MGYYIETKEPRNKAEQICATYPDAQIIPRPARFTDVPASKALVCVVQNGAFDAAAYCFHAREFDCFASMTDERPKTWLLMDKDLVEELTKFPLRKKVNP